MCGAEAMIGAERILVVQCNGVVQKLRWKLRIYRWSSAMVWC